MLAKHRTTLHVREFSGRTGLNKAENHLSRTCHSKYCCFKVYLPNVGRKASARYANYETLSSAKTLLYQPPSMLVPNNCLAPQKERIKLNSWKQALNLSLLLQVARKRIREEKSPTGPAFGGLFLLMPPTVLSKKTLSSGSDLCRSRSWQKYRDSIGNRSTFALTGCNYKVNVNTSFGLHLHAWSNGHIRHRGRALLHL